MNVSEVMTRDVASVRPETPVADAIRMMLTRRVSGLVVVDEENRALGVITEGDLLRRVEIGTARAVPGWLNFLRGPTRQAEDFIRANARRVDEIMTPEIVSVTEDTSLGEAVELMERNNIKRLPVLKDERLIGIVSRADFLKPLLRALSGHETTMDDVSILNTLTNLIDQQSWAPRTGITMHVHDGIVRFEGAIFSPSDREALRVLAETIPGVKGVEDNLVWIEPVSGLPVDSV